MVFVHLPHSKEFYLGVYTVLIQLHNNLLLKKLRYRIYTALRNSCHFRIPTDRHFCIDALFKIRYVWTHDLLSHGASPTIAECNLNNERPALRSDYFERRKVNGNAVQTGEREETGET